jgi:hypothetical protein
MTVFEDFIAHGAYQPRKNLYQKRDLMQIMLLWR